MAWQRKSLSEWIGITTGWFESLVTGASAILRNSMLSVFSRIIAFVASAFEGFLQEQAKNLHVRTMDDEHLRIRAADFGIAPLPATYAIGQGYISGAIGTMIDEGQLLQRSDGILFAIDKDVTITSDPQLIIIAATEPGANGNTIPFVNLSVVSPISGVNSSVSIDENGITGGADDEDTESLRARILKFQANRPRAGADADYTAWVQEIYSNTRVWVIRDYTAIGNVGVMFVFTDRENIFPTAAETAKVLAYLISKAIVTLKTRTHCFSPTQRQIPMSISIQPDTPENRSKVTTALSEYFNAEGQAGGTVLLSKLETIIITTDGITDRDVTVPAGNITLAANEYPVLGTVTWTS